MIGSIGRKFAIAGCSALLAATFALGGCGSSQPASSAASSSAQESSSSSSSVEAAPASDVTFGEETESAQSLLFENETGTAIASLAFVPAGTDPEAAEIMQPDDAWTNGETALVYLEPQGSGRYDILVGVGDADYVLHDFDAELIDNAAIHLEGEVAYVTYEQFGNEVSTLEAETEAAAAAAAEAEAAAAAEAEAAAAEEVYYEEPAAASAPAQSGDACIDGGVVLR